MSVPPQESSTSSGCAAMASRSSRITCLSVRHFTRRFTVNRFQQGIPAEPAKVGGLSLADPIVCATLISLYEELNKTNRVVRRKDCPGDRCGEAHWARRGGAAGERRCRCGDP